MRQPAGCSQWSLFFQLLPLPICRFCHASFCSCWVKRVFGDRAGISAIAQVSEPWGNEPAGVSARDSLLHWAQRVTTGYPSVNVKNFTTSWRDGLAFNAILHRYRPDLINWREVRNRMNTRQRLESAFRIAENEFGVTKLLDPEDVDVPCPDEKSLITYISSLYDALPEYFGTTNYEHDLNEYRAAARDFLQWMQRTVQNLQDRSVPFSAPELKRLQADMDVFKNEDLPPRLKEKQRLERIYRELYELFGDTEYFQIEDELSSDNLDRCWKLLLNVLNEREIAVANASVQEVSARKLIDQLHHEIGVLNERLDVVLQQIEDASARSSSMSAADLQRTVDDIVEQLNELEVPIENLFQDVESLKATRHPQASDYYKQVFGLHQRRLAYLQRCNAQILTEISQRTEYRTKLQQEQYYRTREQIFTNVEECIEWIENRLKELSEMQFVEELSVLEELLEKHKVDHRDVMDFRHQVDNCIARQAEIPAEDSEDYCNLLGTLENEYSQLRELSTGRMLDLDSLIAFIRAAQLELMWISEREELEVTRNWSDINNLDLPMLQNYYKQLLHEIELREEQFNIVHDQGAALINQRHPAVVVIDAYLNTLQMQWDWLLSLTICLETHLQDALNLQQFLEDASSCEQWMERQMQLLNTEYNKGGFSLEEGEKLLSELEEIREMFEKYQEVLMSLVDRSRIISPLWQRGEKITQPMRVTAICNYADKNVVIRKDDECTLLDNSDMVKWSVRNTEEVESVVPSVMFRIPPPDERILAYLNRLQNMFERLRRTWLESNKTVRYNMISTAMRNIRSWDLKQFVALDPDHRDAIIKALNDDANKLLSELDANDPLALKLRDELRATNDYFYSLLQQSLREPNPDIAESFTKKANELIKKLEQSWKTLNERVSSAVPRNMDQFETLVDEHKKFEDSLQALDSDVSMVQELFRQLNDPTPLQRSLLDQLLSKWEDLWDLSKMFAERLKAVELVLAGISEASAILTSHEKTLVNFDYLPADIDKLRALHARLLEIQLLLQQQQPVFDDLASKVARMRQHVARTRYNIADHPDVDQLEEDVQNLMVRWENICVQVIERLKSTEVATQIFMGYRSSYEAEETWLDRVENTINSLKKPDSLEPSEYQSHLDMLVAEYTHLNERTEAVENVNREGGMFIREAKVYDTCILQYRGVVNKEPAELVEGTVSGATQVVNELDVLNRRFSQLASVILERRNVIQVLMQNWRHRQEEEDRMRRVTEENQRRAAEDERRRTLEEEERLKRLREDEERRRAAAKLEAERLQLIRQKEEDARRAAEEAARRAEDEEMARRRAQEELDRLNRLKEDEIRRLKDAEKEAERLRKLEEDERQRRAAEEEAFRQREEEARRKAVAELERLRKLREEEEERLRKAEVEAQRLKQQQEEDARRRAEEAERRLAEEARRRREEEEKRRLAEEARRKAEEDARRRAEEEARRRAEEARRLAEEEARRRAAEATRRRAEEDARRRAEEEARRRLADEEEARRRAEDEARRRAEEEARRRAEEEARRRAEEEARRRAEEEARRRAEEEARRRAEEEARKRTDEEVRRRATEEAKRRAEEEARRRAEDEARRRAEDEARLRKDIEARRLLEEEERRRREQLKPKVPITVNVLDLKTGEERGQTMEWGETGEFELQPEVSKVAKITEHEDDMVMYAEETEIRTKFYELEAVRHVQTGEILTFVEAARQGLLDLRSGEFYDVVSGSRISLEEAVKRGYVSRSLNDCLNSYYGIRDPRTGEELTLLEAVQRNIYDAECRQLRNPLNGELLSLFEASRLGIITVDSTHRLIKMGILKLPPLTLLQAIEQGVLDMQTGLFIGKFSRETLPLSEALRNGYITMTQGPPTMGIGLSDCIEANFVNPQTGEFVDRNGDDKFSLSEALSSKFGSIINLNLREVVNTEERRRVTLNEAVVSKVLNTRQNNFHDTLQNQSISLMDAYEKELIHKPLSFYDILAKDMVDSIGRFIDGGTKKRMVLLEAVAEGLIDPDVPHIVDTDEDDIVSIATAMERGLMTAAGEYVQSSAKQVLNLTEALKAGYIVNPKRFSIFDLRGIKNTKTNASVSFVDAVQQGVVQLSSQRFVNLASNEAVLLSDAALKGIIDATLHSYLSRDCGLKDPYSQGMNVFEAVAAGKINYKTAMLVDPSSRVDLPVTEAYRRGLISLRGAMTLSAFFNVPAPLVLPLTKTKRKRLRRRGEGVSKEELGRMSVGEALRQGYVDAKSQRITNKEMTVQEAIDAGLLDTGYEWIVPDKGTTGGPTIQESRDEKITETTQVLPPRSSATENIEETITTVKRQKTTETTAFGGPLGITSYRALTGGQGVVEVPVEGLHLYKAERLGMIDLNSGLLTLPEVSRRLTFEEAIDLGIINHNSIKVRDRKSSEMVSVSVALERSILDSNGTYTDQLNGKKMSLRAAIDSNFITVEPEVPTDDRKDTSLKKVIQFGVSPSTGLVMSYNPIGTSVREESEDAWTFDSATGEVMDACTGERISIDTAINTGKLDIENLRIKDTLTDREMSFNDAEKWGVINMKTRKYVDKKSNEEITLQEAAKRKLVFLTLGEPKLARQSLKTHVRQRTLRVVASKEPVVAGPAAFVDYSLQKVIDLGWYDPSTGTFTHPDTKRKMTLKQAIMKGLFNPYESTVIDPDSKDHLSLLDAVHRGVLDAEQGVLLNKSTGQKYDLQKAYQNGFIRSEVASQSLDAAINSGRLNLVSGMVQSPDGSASLSLHEAIAKGLIDVYSMEVRDPSTNTIMNFAEAIKDKMIDLSRGMLINKTTGEATSLVQALMSGIIKPIPTTESMRYRAGGTHGLESLESTTSKELAVPSAGGPRRPREELIDIGGKKVMMKVVRDERGVEMGEYMDPETKMKFRVELRGDPYQTRMKTSVRSTAQVQSIELSPNAELIAIDKVRDKRSGRVMSLADAQRLGLAKVDKKGKQLTKSYSVFRSDIAYALSHGVIDPSTGEKLSLVDGIKARLIDIVKLHFFHPESGEGIDLTQAANLGFIDVTLAEVLPKGVCNPVNGERISISRAVELKIINPRTGEVLNPFSNEKLSWMDILKPVYASLTMEGIYDPRKGYAVPVTSALNEGLIDVHKQMYCNPITSESMPLKVAMESGLIDETTYKTMIKECIRDWQSGRIVSLVEAVDRGIVDSHNRTVQVSKGMTYPIGRAVEEKGFPAEIGRLLKRVDKWTFAEALGKGLIDVAANLFTDPDNGRKMTIAQALEEGYIDTGSVGDLEGKDERNLANVVESDEFDPNTGRIRDPKSGLYLTFKQAIDRGIIDGDSLIYDVDHGQTITLSEAITRGRIDTNGKLVDTKTHAKVTLNDAVQVGLIALISSPMKAGQAAAEAIKRRETDSFRFKIQRPSSPLIQEAPRKVINESVITRTTTTTLKKPDSGLHAPKSSTTTTTTTSVEVLPPEDFDARFLHYASAMNFDPDEKLLRHPATGANMSLRQYVQQGLLDVSSGQIVNPVSGSRCSIPKAVHLNILSSDTADVIMEVLNSLSDVSQQKGGGAGVTTIRRTTVYTSGGSPSTTSTSATILPSPRSPTSSSSGAATSYTKEVNWKGQTSELRDPHTDLSAFTKVSGVRLLPYEDDGL